MTQPIFVMINNRYLNATNLEELVFDDNNWTIDIVYDNKRLRETYSDFDTYKRMKAKLGRILHLGTMRDIVRTGSMLTVETPVSSILPEPEVHPHPHFVVEI